MAIQTVSIGPLRDWVRYDDGDFPTAIEAESVQITKVASADDDVVRKADLNTVIGADNFVTKDGDETITGKKTIENNLCFEGDERQIGSTDANAFVIVGNGVEALRVAADAVTQYDGFYPMNNSSGNFAYRSSVANAITITLLGAEIT